MLVPKIGESGIVIMSKPKNSLADENFCRCLVYTSSDGRMERLSPGVCNESCGFYPCQGAFCGDNGG